MNDATQRVTQWIIGVRDAVPLEEELATAENVQHFVCGHVRWADGTLGPAVELEDIDWSTVYPFIEQSPSASLCYSCVIIDGKNLTKMQRQGISSQAKGKGQK